MNVVAKGPKNPASVPNIALRNINPNILGVGL